eukprot:CAMPEP_0171676174 /NCGR_PEP_ID=MMETSP0990-20121206/54266_1 /TAXON_ID=483369 /ORGANISM="non described non described, Strain CCMP2098" /LENGTH=199 /DNA_ID=CAMNT_0012262281 /DNA_START=27 /DNA_END=626 /DNA_ORIENTATION=+
MDPEEIVEEREMSRSKRNRVQGQATAEEENIDVPVRTRSKRNRVQGQATAEEENIDVPMYTPRHMMQLEQGKNAEMQRVRDEVQQYVAQKDQEVAASLVELEALRGHVTAQQGEVGRISNENRILKQGVRIQQQAAERCRAEVDERLGQERATFMQVGAQAAEHIRQLETQNYALRVQLEQMAPASVTSEGMPRWGEGF